MYVLENNLFLSEIINQFLPYPLGINISQPLNSFSYLSNYDFCLSKINHICIMYDLYSVLSTHFHGVIEPKLKYFVSINHIGLK